MWNIHVAQHEMLHEVLEDKFLSTLFPVFVFHKSKPQPHTSFCEKYLHPSQNQHIIMLALSYEYFLYAAS